ncbi:MAG: hypothetical protein J0L92_06850 [Deltaproteobacteria bacterium]|nr:hypothetical protein [Deltaproteobacteria bacterium]
MTIETSIDEFRASISAILKASKTPHVSVAVHGRVEPGAFHGGRFFAAAKPPVETDDAKTKAAYTTIFAAYEAEGTPLHQLSVRAERASKKSAWTVNTFPLTKAAHDAAVDRRAPVDGKVATALRSSSASSPRGWERLTLVQDRDRQRLIRRVPGQKPEDLPVDVELAAFFDAAREAYREAGFGLTTMRWDVPPEGSVEFSAALDPL